MIDDEPGVAAEALRTQPARIAVPGDNQQIESLGRGNNFAFDLTVPSDVLHGSAGPLGGGRQQLRFRL